MKKANMTWSAKMYVKKINNGEVTFDNTIQRGYVWDVRRKSLLIHSMIEGYPIPPFMSVRDEETHNLDMLDGKQRSEAIRSFMADEYALVDVPEVTYTENGQEFIDDINGKKYSELPEDIRDEIADYSLTIYYFQDITDEEINEMFFRLNNGKPLSAIELTRVKAKSYSTIKELAKHDIFKSTLTEKALSKFTNEEIVIKSWIMLNMPSPSFESKAVRDIMSVTDITEAQKTDIKLAFDRLVEIHDTIIASDPDDKMIKKTAKKLYTKTHFLSCLPLIVRSINDMVDVYDLSDWLQKFFQTDDTSISEEYNKGCINGSGKTDSIRKRVKALEESYNTYFNKSSLDDEESEEAFI